MAQQVVCGSGLAAAAQRARAPTSSASSRPGSVPAGRGLVRTCANDALCKDMVNVTRAKEDLPEGTAVISFLGASGTKVDVECPLDTYILDAALDAGVELPYTCRGGICGACVGRVASGAVDQSDIADLSFTLDEEEVAKGMALLCMSRPLGDCQIETQSDWGYSLGTTEWKGATGHIQGKKPEPLTPWQRQQQEATQ